MPIMSTRYCQSVWSNRQQQPVFRAGSRPLPAAPTSALPIQPAFIIFDEMHMAKGKDTNVWKLIRHIQERASA